MSVNRFLGVLLTAVSLAWPGPASAQAPASADRDRGQALYQAHCTVCHGPDGRAETPVGRMLRPRPRNFADPVEMARVSADRIYAAIKEGRPGTAMASWDGVLSETDIGDVVDYIRGLAPREGPGTSSRQLSLEIGRRLYERDCRSCHGVDGQPPAEIARVLSPPPRSFADPIEMARLDDTRMYTAIKLGRPGTAMGGHGDLLSPLEIIDVMRYVRTLARPAAAGMSAEALDVAVGQQIYRQYCDECHGEKGDGQTPLGRALQPAPRDFTDARQMATVPDAQLATAIAQGKPGTAMAPWRGILNAEDVRRVVLFIRKSLQGAP